MRAEKLSDNTSVSKRPTNTSGPINNSKSPEQQQLDEKTGAYTATIGLLLGFENARRIAAQTLVEEHPELLDGYADQSLLVQLRNLQQSVDALASAIHDRRGRRADLRVMPKGTRMSKSPEGAK